MIGFLFACSGMTLFLSMIVVTEVSRMVVAVIADASSGIFEHDTDVFPDYTPN